MSNANHQPNKAVDGWSRWQVCRWLIVFRKIVLTNTNAVLGWRKGKFEKNLCMLARGDRSAAIASTRKYFNRANIYARGTERFFEGLDHCTCGIWRRMVVLIVEEFCEILCNAAMDITCITHYSAAALRVWNNAWPCKGCFSLCCNVRYQQLLIC